MPEDETQEVPLPPGTIPDQENVITQEIPAFREPFPEVKIISPVRVELPPLHLMNDPIMTMDAPVPDNTPLYDQLNPPAPKPLPKRPRRRMHTGDKFLVGMAVAAVGLGTGVYGMVFLGWGASPAPQAEEKPEPSVIAETTESPEPTVLPTTREKQVPKAPESKAPVRVVADPTTYSPKPEESIVVVESPDPSSAPETPVETTEAPEPSPSPTKPSTPPPSPTPTPTSASPTPTESGTPVLPPSLSASSTPEESSG